MTHADLIYGRIYGEWICFQQGLIFFQVWCQWRDSFWRKYKMELMKAEADK